MAVYIIVALVAVAILWGAYRAFGGAASAPVDNLAQIRRAADSARSAAQEITGAAAERRSVRRTLDGCAQLLEQVDAAALDDRALSAHRLVTGAVEELIWATRLRDVAAFDTKPGLREAEHTLRSDAIRALREAADDLRSVSAKEVDSPA